MEEIENIESQRTAIMQKAANSNDATIPEVYETFGKSFLSLKVDVDEIIGNLQTKIEEAKKICSEEFAKAYIQAKSDCEVFSKIIDYFGITDFAFYVYRTDDNFIEYLTFYRDNQELFNMRMNASEYGDTLVSDIVNNTESMIESYECNLEEKDDEIFEEKLDEFTEWFNGDLYSELEKHITEIEKTFLSYSLYQE